MQITCTYSSQVTTRDNSFEVYHHRVEILVERCLNFISTSIQFENEMLSQTFARKINAEPVMPESALARENILAQISNRV